jgi:signal transduction histidine kinase
LDAVSLPLSASLSDSGEQRRQGAACVRALPRVWLVDDSPGQREFAQRALHQHYDITSFADGPTMLESLGANAPDVLVVDWQMPHLSGIEICRYVRSRKDAATLPILMLSALGTSETLLEALAAGANDYVKIPFRSAELLARVGALARLASLHARITQIEAQLRLEADFRERFMGMLAHDLRQPVSAVMMANHILSRPETSTAEAAHLLAVQQRAGDRMKRMITELLDFTRNRPESGLPLEREPTDWIQVLRETLDEIRSNHPTRQIELTVEGACVGYWDRDRLVQLCSNLIGNAIDHGSATGPVLVALRAEPEHVELRVSNLGGQLAREELLTYFEPFRRAVGKGRSGSGVGLGLYIVAQITRAHHGTIDVQNRDEWTDFVVRLPREAPLALDAPAS